MISFTARPNTANAGRVDVRPAWTTPEVISGVDALLEQWSASLPADRATAIVHLKKAIALDPASDAARLTYADVLLEEDDAPAAQAQLEAPTAHAGARAIDAMGAL